MQKIALVTGASSGIGEAVAKRLAREVDHVVLIGRDETRLTAVREAIEAAGGHASQHPVDLTDPKSVWHFSEDLSAAHDHLDILVQCAGGLTFDNDPKFEGNAFASIAAHVQMNFLSKVLMFNACIELLEKAEHPVILDVSSQASKFPEEVDEQHPFAARTHHERGYVHSMRAVDGYNRMLKRDLPKKFRIRRVNPGLVATPLQAKHFSDAPASAIKTPEELAEHIVQKVLAAPRAPK